MFLTMMYFHFCFLYCSLLRLHHQLNKANNTTFLSKELTNVQWRHVSRVATTWGLCSIQVLGRGPICQYSSQAWGLRSLYDKSSTQVFFTPQQEGRALSRMGSGVHRTCILIFDTSHNNFTNGGTTCSQGMTIIVVVGGGLYNSCSITQSLG